MRLPFGPEVSRLVMTGLAVWALAAVGYGAWRLTFGTRPAYINVR